MGDGKRRLPLVQPSEDEGEPRPPWHWAGIGAVATLLALLPLSWLATWSARCLYDASVPTGDPEDVRRSIESMTPGKRLVLGMAVVLGPVIALALAAMLGGVLVGRFGGRAGKREAALAGLVAAAFSSALAAREFLGQPGGAAVWLLSSVVLLIVAGGMGLLGGWLGRRVRPGRSARG